MLNQLADSAQLVFTTVLNEILAGNARNFRKLWEIQKDLRGYRHPNFPTKNAANCDSAPRLAQSMGLVEQMVLAIEGSRNRECTGDRTGFALQRDPVRSVSLSTVPKARFDFHLDL